MAKIIRSFVAFYLFVLLPASAFAACSNPVGNPGDTNYNTSFNQYMYCDGTDWVSMGVGPGTGGGCVSPAGGAGDMNYNTTYHVAMYCNGNEWVAMGPVGDDVTGVSTSGLVGHWKLDDGAGTTATDSAGSNDGTLTGGTWITGVDVGALSFNGTSDYVTLGPSNAVLTSTYPWTISLWFKANTISGSSLNNRLIDFYYNSGSTSFLAALGSTNKAQLYIYNGSTSTTVNIGTVSTGTWYNLVVTYDGTDYISYLNAVQVNVTTYGLRSLSATNATLGALYNGTSGSNYFDGKIDDVRIYNRALSATEIQNLYSASSYNAGMVGHWKLDDGAGTTATDSSGYGNDGTLTNMDAATDWGTGIKAGALNFDGVNDLVNIPHTAELMVTDTLTLSAWIKPVATDSQDRIVIKRIGGSWDVYGLMCNANATETSCYIQFRAYDCSNNGTTFGTEANSTVPLNQWSHVAATFDDSADTVRIYVNGVQTEADLAFTRTICGTNTQDVEIGGQTGTSRWFDGDIDDVRIYNRALSSTEIQRQYGCTAPAYVEGTMLYNPSWRSMQYCNGYNWVGVGKPVPATADCPNIGDVCIDGSVYAGLSPDGNVPMYTTPADAGQLPWNNGNSSGYVATGQTSTVTGETNTGNIINIDSDSGTAGKQPHQAAQYCADLSAHGHTDWYLPSQDELNVLYTNNAAIGGFNTSGSFPAGYYKTSSEFTSDDRARHQNFSDGAQGSGVKQGNTSFRCVRRY